MEVNDFEVRFYKVKLSTELNKLECLNYKGGIPSIIYSLDVKLNVIFDSQFGIDTIDHVIKRDFAISSVSLYVSDVINYLEYTRESEFYELFNFTFAERRYIRNLYELKIDNVTNSIYHLFKIFRINKETQTTQGKAKMITLLPAYNRDYKSKKEFIEDLKANKDFILVDFTTRAYANLSDLQAQGIINVQAKYCKQTKASLINITKI